MIYTKNKHCHAADERKDQTQILCDSVKRKAIDDLTQKPTWRILEKFEIIPRVNSPACLVYWRIFVYLLGLLPDSQIARIRTDYTESILIYTKNKHCHAADERKDQTQILCDSVKRKAIDDLTQKPTWRILEKFEIFPRVNSPACLVYWRIFVYLLGLLPDSQIARIRTDYTESILIYTKNKHCHAADKHKDQTQILCDSVKRKAIDDLTQKPTKQIRTELVKMTSEASLLPTDLKSIHQTVERK